MIEKIKCFLGFHKMHWCDLHRLGIGSIYDNRQPWNDETQKPYDYIPMGKYKPISNFPYIERDVTVIEPKSEVWAVTEIILNGGKYLEKVFKVGEYRPKKSVTFKMIFQSRHRNLDKKEVAIAMKNIEEALKCS